MTPREIGITYTAPMGAAIWRGDKWQEAGR